MNKRFNRVQPICIAVICALSGASHAAVNDIFPGDYFPPSSSSLAVYAYNRSSEGPYRNGSKLADGRMETQILALRAVHASWIGNMPLASVAVLPWASVGVSPAPLSALLGSPAGTGDIRLGAVVWPFSDQANNEHVGLNAMVILPTGQYDSSRILNIGENRWRLVLGGGWQKALTYNLIMELAPEFAWYGDNDNYSGGKYLEQQSSFALTTYLRYRITPIWHVFLGGQLNEGGSTRIDGVGQSNPPDNRRTTIGVSWFGASGQQWVLRGARDSHIENGFKTSEEITVRYTQNF